MYLFKIQKRIEIIAIVAFSIFIIAISTNARTEECTGRGPHIGIYGTCCKTSVQISECGFGTARDWDCRLGMEEGSPELRERICDQLRQKNKLCPEIAPYCDDCEDLKARIDAARDKVSEAQKRAREAHESWQEALSTLENIRNKYISTQQKLRTHTQDAFETVSGVIECAHPGWEANDEYMEMGKEYRQICWSSEKNGTEFDHIQKELECERLEKHLRDKRNEVVGIFEDCEPAKELWEKDRDYWNDLVNDLSELEKDYDKAAMRESKSADNYQEESERLRQSSSNLRELEKEYSEKCESNQ